MNEWTNLLWAHLLEKTVTLDSENKRSYQVFIKIWEEWEKHTAISYFKPARG